MGTDERALEAAGHPRDEPQGNGPVEPESAASAAAGAQPGVQPPPAAEPPPDSEPQTEGQSQPAAQPPPPVQPQPAVQPCAEPAAAAPGPEPALTQELEALRGELEQVQAALQERQDQYLRVQAEFENYKKRFQKEQAEAARYVNLPLLRDLASIMDNMERAVSHAEGPEGQELASFLKGIELVIKQLGDTFEKYGMTRIKTVGAPFDPRRQEAVSVAENDAVPENHVVEEYQPGYVLHERVVRPAMVVVAKRSSESKADEPGSE